MSAEKIQPPPQAPEKDEIVPPPPLNITSENFPKFIHVRFHTSTSQEIVGNQVFEVPSHLTRYGLSELVNHILTKKNPNRKIEPFEFLIPYEKGKKVFLRTSLQQFFLKIQKWPETLTNLEYVSSQPSPKNTDTIPHNDWVSVIRHVLPTIDVGSSDPDGLTDLLISGCYDGVVRIWDPKKLTIISQYRYFSSLSDMDVIPLGGTTHQHHLTFSSSNFSPFDLLMLCCGKTEYAHVISYHHNTKSIQRKKVLTGHSEKVNCVRIQPLQDRTVFITGSNDKSVKLYFSDGTDDNRDSDDEEEEEEVEKQRKKKKKRRLETKRPTFSLVGHRLAVKCLEYNTNENKLFSGSDDHTIKIWDLNQQKLIGSRLGGKVISSMSYQAISGLALTAHPDHVIRMWDTRSKNPPRVFRSHKGWVRCVDWSKGPSSQPGSSSRFRFVSGGDDNQIKIWDIRSAIPLSSIPHHVSKEEMEKKKKKKKIAERDEDKDDDEVEEEEEEEELWTLAKKRNPYERNRHKVLSIRYAENSDSVFFSGSTDCTLKRNVMKSSAGE